MGQGNKERSKGIREKGFWNFLGKKSFELVSDEILDDGLMTKIKNTPPFSFLYKLLVLLQVL